MVSLPDAAILAAAQVMSGQQQPSARVLSKAAVSLRMALPHLYAVESFAGRLPAARIVVPTTASETRQAARSMQKHAAELDRQSSEIKRQAARMLRNAKLMEG